jgi:hypothetical protein
LGNPNPSAVEHYLNQDKKITHGYINTYGDLPTVETSGVELKGRKFYRHQAAARNDNTAFIAGEEDTIKSKHGTLARFICQQGRSFKYKLRFKNLHDWEIGAVLLALNPDLVRQVPDSADFTPTNQEPVDGVVFAQKLGYGRPLGLGSISNKIKAVNILNTDEIPKWMCKIDELNNYTEAFIKYAEEHQLPLKQWLEVVKYAGTENETFAYPSKEDRGRTTIYNYHTDIRRKHSQERRTRNPENGRICANIIKP